MTNATDHSNMSMLMGEMRGQLREVIHTMNNLATKVDTIFERTGSIPGMAIDIKDLDERLAKLEAESVRREGMTSVFGMMMKSPALGWVVGAAMAIWAFIAERINL